MAPARPGQPAPSFPPHAIAHSSECGRVKIHTAEFLCCLKPPRSCCCPQHQLQSLHLSHKFVWEPTAISSHFCASSCPVALVPRLSHQAFGSLRDAAVLMFIIPVAETPFSPTDLILESESFQSPPRKDPRPRRSTTSSYLISFGDLTLSEIILLTLSLVCLL